MVLRNIYGISLTVIFLLISGSCNKRGDHEAIKYIDGFIFDGIQFNKSSFTVKDGLFYLDTLIKSNTTVDLNGQYVIPPFGDAHTHNFDDITQFDSIYKAYVNEGTFYVQVLTNHYSNFLKIKDSLNLDGRIDAKFAHGGITSSGGHPQSLYESQALNYSWRAMFDPQKKEEILTSRIKENDAYYIVDSPGQLDEKWQNIMSNDPDLIKIYILNTSERAKKMARREVGTYGLSKDVIEAIVKKAKDKSITLVAHVETVADFELALTLGVRHFAHMPGYGGGIGNTELEQLEIPDSLLEVASGRRISMTPTVSFAKYYATIWNGTEMSLDTALLNRKYDFIRRQLRRFMDAKIEITLGADQNNTTLTEEIDDLIEINAFSNLEFLNILVNAPKSIFPNRKIGKIDDGYEASFLVLENNPLDDISNIKNIQLKVKNGFVLD